MPRGNRSKRTASVDWVLPLIGITLAILLAFGAGWLQAREEYKRQYTPTAYADAARKDAERACVGREPAAVFECVDEKVKAAYQAAHDEQDLSAQQRAASAALISAVVGFLALAISIVGVWYVKRTLDATLDAVEDTSVATEAMREANEISRHVAESDLRPYLFVDRVELIERREGEEAAEEKSDPLGQETLHKTWFSGRVVVHLRNFGKTPARNIHVFIKQYMGRTYKGQFSGLQAWGVDTWICAPGHERRVFGAIYVNKNDRPDFDIGILRYIIRLRIRFEDDRGNVFTEKAGFVLGGDELETFYLFHRAEVAEARKWAKERQARLDFVGSKRRSKRRARKKSGNKE